MLDYIWGIMIIIGVAYGVFTGRTDVLANAILESSGEAVSICMMMIGTMSIWVGVMRIAEKAGLIAKITGSLHPVIQFLFPDLPEDHPARHYIATNFIANILGLGSAATPAGLEAMKELSNFAKEQGEEKGQASDEMCTFLVINMSSLQLIPINIIAFRSRYGSIHPTAIVAPAILATFASTIAGTIFCKIMQRRAKP